jgi:hypothetical protein
MQPKYQIFISSTYEDLKDERSQVIKAVLEMGHIPVGMEMFSAADEEQWEIIKSHIDQSDYYIVLVAHRYGSVFPDGKSFTRQEYEYALARGVPILGFLLNPSAEWSPNRIDSKESDRASLDSFKALIRQKPVGWWSTPNELHGLVATALVKQFTTRPRPGWIRSTLVPGPEVLDELTRLSGENSALREALEIAQAKLTAEQSLYDASNLAQNDDPFELDVEIDGNEEKVKTTWDSVFLCIGQVLLSNTADDMAISQALAREFVRQGVTYSLTSKECIDKIKIQLMALGFIEMRVYSTSQYYPPMNYANDSGLLAQASVVGWFLTSRGTQKLVNLMAIRRESIAATTSLKSDQ